MRVSVWTENSKIIYCVIYSTSISSIINYLFKNIKYKFYHKVLYIKFFTLNNKSLYLMSNINNGIYN